MADGLLVEYGRAGFVGRFIGGEAVPRGEPAVVRTPRGVELGRSLGPADPRFGAALAAAGGEVLRPATTADLSDADRLAAVGRELLAAADGSAHELPLAFVDAEVLLDGPAILHAVVWADADVDPLLAELSERFARPVTLFDVARVPAAADPPPAKGCGKPGCGSDGGGCSSGDCGSSGGCSTGSCSRGAVKSADELTAYFADLRRQMEARIPLS